MAEKKRAGGLTRLERAGGTVFFAFYLLLLPLAAEPARRLAGELLGGGSRRSCTARSTITRFSP